MTDNESVSDNGNLGKSHSSASSDHALLDNNIKDLHAMLDNTTEPHPAVHNSPPAVDVTSLPLFQAGFIIWKASPISVVLGTYGNVAVFLVFYEKKRARSSMSVFFMSLAVTDLIGIYFNLVPRCVNLGFNFDIKGLHDLMCKLFLWIDYSSSTMSTWLLVVMVTHRTLFVVWHQRTNSFFLKIPNFLVLIILITFSLAMNGLFLVFPRVVTMKFNNSSVITSCNFDYQDELSVAVYNIWFGLDTITSSFLPFIILLVDNVLLIRHVRRSTREARLRLAVGSQQQIKVREHKVVSMTVILITTSLTFFLMTFPYYVVEGVSMFITDKFFSDVGVFEIIGFTWNIVTFLWCSHHSVNFYLYCLTGSRFRARARHVLFRCNTGSTITHSSSATGTSCREQPA